MRTAVIVVHAVAGTVAFASGAVLVARRLGGTSRRLYATYLTGIAVLAITSLVAVAMDWTDLSSGARAAFVALIALAVVMATRAGLARTSMPGRDHDNPRKFIDHIGFTLIALFDGFVIVTALDLGAPTWLVTAVAVAGVLVGQRTLHGLEQDGQPSL